MSSSLSNIPQFHEPHAIYFNDFGIDLPIDQLVPAITFTQDIISRLPVCFVRLLLYDTICVLGLTLQLSL
jgi:hypothetical protein